MSETMDVTGSLRKVSRELLALERGDPDLEIRLEAASWLISYIADALDVELQHAANRGRMLATKQLEQGSTRPVPSENMGALDNWDF